MLAKGDETTPTHARRRPIKILIADPDYFRRLRNVTIITRMTTAKKMTPTITGVWSFKPLPEPPPG
jgi:hypothetical protein